MNTTVNAMTDFAASASSDFVGPIADLATWELVRAASSAQELREALIFVASEASRDARAYEALPQRMRRLVDLVTVVGPDTSRAVCGDPMVNAI